MKPENHNNESILGMGNMTLEEYVAKAPEHPYDDPFYQNTVETDDGNPWWGTPDYETARKIGILGIYAKKKK